VTAAEPFRELDTGRSFDEPRTDRLDPHHPHFAAIIAAHRIAMVNGDGTYLDPATGFIVITAQAHADRGFCCENGCRHCPYRPH
jgi:hypothetical protein